MAKLSMKLKLDTSELDRLAIGARVYDKLNLSNPDNIFKVKNGELVVYEKDVIDIINLINETIKPKVSVKKETRIDRGD